MLYLRHNHWKFSLNNKMFNSEYSSLMFQVLKQVTALFYSFHHVNAVLCLITHPFVLGYIRIWKINMEKFIIHQIPLLVLLCIYIPFLPYLCFSCLVSTLEYVNHIKALSCHNSKVYFMIYWQNGKNCSKQMNIWIKQASLFKYMKKIYLKPKLIKSD